MIASRQLSGFADDGKRAMAASPDYFLRWYTIKSIGLGVVAAGLAFMIGRATAHAARRG